MQLILGFATLTVQGPQLLGLGMGRTVTVAEMQTVGTVTRYR